MASNLELAEVGFIERIVVGNNDPRHMRSEEDIRLQMERVNRCLSGTPRGRIVGMEKSFALHTIGDQQFVLQYVVYHLGFVRKPLYLDEYVLPEHAEPEPATAQSPVQAAAAAETLAVQVPVAGAPAPTPQAQAPRELACPAPGGTDDEAPGNGLTLTRLRQLLSHLGGDATAAQWLEPLNAAMQACAIDTPARQAAFLAQVLVESSELRCREESLSYTPQRLRAVWPQRFLSDERAAHYSHNPQALANYIYAGRMGNGDETSGDGWRYHGRGLIQLTGRDNYAQFARTSGLDVLAQPDLLLEPAGAARAAAWFWQTMGLNELADRTAGSDGDIHFMNITKRINGQTIGLEERRAYWQRARRALGLH